MNHSTKLFTKDFTLVVIGQIISLFGNSILRFAVPLYLLNETGSAALFGLVSACSFLPMIVLSLLGGVLADRVNKKDIMVLLDFSTAVLILAFSLFLGHLPMVPLFIVTLMLLYGIQGTYQPAVQASIPSLVSGTNLLTGNAVINQINALANLLGPVIGGVLFGVWGLKIILYVSIICFAVSAILELFIHIPHQPQKRETGVFPMIRSDLLDSFRFMKWEKPVFLRVISLILLFNFFLSSMLIIGLPVLITKTLGLSEQLFGYSQGALAAGGLTGGILTGLLGKRLSFKNCHWLLLIAACLTFPMSLSLFLSAPVMVSYLVITVSSFLLMSAATMFTVLILSFVQAETPAHLVGKVISCVLALSMCAQPLGQACYGVLFQKLPHMTWVILLGTGLISCGIALYSKRAFRNIT